MYKDQIDLQAEVDALDKHMANLNNQNYCLQKELEGFIEADDVVRKGLDRRSQVEQIRSKVDDVIKRSQAEVTNRISASKQKEVSYERTGRVMTTTTHTITQDQRNMAKSASNYSPLRESYNLNA